MGQEPKTGFVGVPSVFECFGGEANVGFSFIVVISCDLCLINYITHKAFFVHWACLSVPTRTCTWLRGVLLENFFVVSIDYFCHVGHARVG